MSSNSNTIADEDGDHPDWFELYNPGVSSISLEGYGITDDEQEQFKWIFPDIEMQPAEHLLVFASGKDSYDFGGHWETIINWGDNWKYFVGANEPPSDWNESGFDDSGWLSGASGFGYGDGDDNTIVSQTISLFIRKEIIVEDLENIMSSVFHIDYDDAFVAYLNGSEIARANIGEPGIIPAYDQPAEFPHEAVIYQDGNPEAFEINTDLLQIGNNCLAIQIHNIDLYSSDLSLIPFFTLQLTEIPDDPNGSPDILKLSSQHLHTNFKINSQGEPLILSDPEGNVLDSLFTGIIPSDISKGRQPDGENDWFFFDEPTPETTNNTAGFQDISEEPQFSQAGGFYSGNLEISMTVDSPSAQIFYTLDGSEPADSSYIYDQPLPINSTTVLRAKTYETANLPSKTVTHTYFIDEEQNLPVISLSTTPANFFDDEIGIYVQGSGDEPNFWQDWERPVHIEFFEPDGNPGFSIGAGAKIYGGWTRNLPQKSLSIFARNFYGSNEIPYQLFPDKNINSFEAFVLRNSGNDWDSTMLRDGLMTGLVADTGLDISGFRPCVVYINGYYWGIHNIREKMNEHFIAANNPGTDADNIDMLEGGGWVIHGDAQHYASMINFVENNDLSMQANYEYMQTQMDIDNFITYQLSQIYFDNRDWPGNNIKFWRPRTANGKWQWLIFDTDFGFGLFNQNAFMYNTLEFATEANGQEWPNPPWSTLLLRKLLENESFKNDFINYFCDHLNTSFQALRVLEHIDTKVYSIQPEFSQHNARWENYIWNWQNNLDVLENFGVLRLNYIRNHLQTYFELNEKHTVTLDVSPENTGMIKINSRIISEFSWQGEYFEEVPVTVTAIPAAGYEFVMWEGFTFPEPEMTLNLTGDTNITAIFQETSGDSVSIVINEINYNSAADFDPEDWLELHNPTDQAIDISGWKFRDENDAHIFEIPENTILQTDEFIVLCKDLTAFSTLFPEVDNCIGDLGFGLSGAGELLRLFDQYETLIDTVHYYDSDPWPQEPDGNGPTLELINPFYDNSLAENWSASENHGTPGLVNSSIVAVKSSLIDEHKFFLRPAFPNPFTMETTISFQIPKKQKVELSIYNIKGQLVTKLVDEKLETGNHKIVWKAGNIASGVYLYRLKTKEKVKIRKFLLLK